MTTVVSGSVDKQKWSIHTRHQCWARKRNEVLIRATTWTNPKTLSSVEADSPLDHVLYNSIHIRMSRKCKSMDTDFLDI